MQNSILIPFKKGNEMIIQNFVLEIIGKLAETDQETFNKIKRNILDAFTPYFHKTVSSSLWIKNFQAATSHNFWGNDLAFAIFTDSLIRRVFDRACRLCDFYKENSLERSQSGMMTQIIWMINQSPDSFAWLGRLRDAEKITGEVILVPAFPLTKTATKTGIPLNANDYLKKRIAANAASVEGILKEAEEDIRLGGPEHKSELFDGIDPTKWKSILSDRKKEWEMSQSFYHLLMHGVQNEKEFTIALNLGEEYEINSAEEWLQKYDGKNEKFANALMIARTRLELLREQRRRNS